MKFIFKNIKIIFCCSLFFLLGSLITLNIVQVDNCIDNPLQSNNVYYRSAQFKNPNLVILIISAPTNLNRRNVVRETWLSLDKNSKKQLMHYFVIGSMGLSTDLMLHLSTEQSRYNDLLILPIQDSYSNLSFKILQSFVWLNEQTLLGFNFSYVLKCDDDSFLRTNLLLDEIETLRIRLSKQIYAAINDTVQSINIQKNVNTRNKLNVYWGYFNGNAKIKTQGKWTETNWILCNNYIPYAQGGGYIISQGLVSYLAKNAEHLVLFSSEDVSLGTWLASVTNIIRIHDTRFDTEWNSRGCLNSNLIFHKIPIADMKTMYNNIKEYNKPCITETTRRKHYLYNWNITPSKCCNRV